MRVAVVAHERKELDGDLNALRAALADRGVDDIDWHQVPKSKKAPEHAEEAVDKEPDVLLVWGGDGTVRRCLDAAAGSRVPIGILPAGSANLLAGNLGIPEDLEAALDIALGDTCRIMDVGLVNGERFAVMAGTGFDAVMIRDAEDRKDRLGRFAYVVSGPAAMKTEPAEVVVEVDGDTWFEGLASCVLIGNVGTATGGLRVFPDASTHDGLLEIGVVTADGRWEWSTVLIRLALGSAERSRYVHTTRGAEIVVQLDRALTYEVDGGDRSPTDHLEVTVDGAAVQFMVPAGR